MAICGGCLSLMLEVTVLHAPDSKTEIFVLKPGQKHKLHRISYSILSLMTLLSQRPEA